MITLLFCSADYLDFFVLHFDVRKVGSNTQEMEIQRKLYNRQERLISSTYTKLCDLRDKLSSQQTTLMSQLKQVGEQLKQVNQQLDKFS